MHDSSDCLAINPQIDVDDEGFDDEELHESGGMDKICVEDDENGNLHTSNINSAIFF